MSHLSSDCESRAEVMRSRNISNKERGYARSYHDENERMSLSTPSNVLIQVPRTRLEALHLRANVNGDSVARRNSSAELAP